MCGIALILSGVRIDSSSTSIRSGEEISLADNVQPIALTIDGLKAALRRRGPDSLGTKKVLLGPKDAAGTLVLPYVVPDEEVESRSFCFHALDGHKTLADGGNEFGMAQSIAEMYFIGSVLQLRGTKPVVQPLVDASENVLVYNGEIFGGINMGSDCNDAEVLLQSLGNCCLCHSHGTGSGCSGKPVPVLLSSIKGPWALIYWQVSSLNECLKDSLVWQRCIWEKEPPGSLAHVEGLSAPFVFCVTFIFCCLWP